MELYTFLRHMADSWGMLAMLLAFLGICLWALRPASRPLHDDAANSIFRNDAAPAEASQPDRKEA